MVELPSKRPRRRDSPDRSTRDSRREDRGGRERYNRDSNRERDRRYRSCSRSRDRDWELERDRDRHRERQEERGGRRDDRRDRDQDRERNRESGRGGRRDDGRDRRDYRSVREGGDKDRDRDREERKRHREDDGQRRDRDRNTRSRSPAREPSAPLEAGRSPARARALENDDFVGVRSRTATPPVAFKVGLGAQGHTVHGRSQREVPAEANGGQSHAPSAFVSDAMDTDNPAASGDKAKKSKKSVKQSKIENNVEEDDDIVVEEDGSMAAMQAMLGFGGFGTTKQKKIPGNDVYAVRKEKKTEYRQYMNRVGGFNRPLSPSRD